MPLPIPVPQGSRRIKRAYSASLSTLVFVGLLGSGCSTVPDTPPPREEPKAAPIIIETPPPPPDPLTRWQQLISDKQHSPIDEKLEAVNTFFNQLEFVDDLTHWGQGDYWATPEETLLSNGGDCEDFSIAKYFTLKQLNVPEESMRLTYVKALQLDQPHMVLCYYPEPQGEPLVLDNMKKVILPASRRPDLAPVYCFNVEGLWLAQQRGEGMRVGDASRLSAWQSVLARTEEARFSRLLVKVGDVALEPCALGINCPVERLLTGSAREERLVTMLVKVGDVMLEPCALGILCARN